MATEEKPMTLAMMREAICSDWAYWSTQRGPNDHAGYERDQDRLEAIEEAENFTELHNASPMEWQTAVSNRCHRVQV